MVLTRDLHIGDPFIAVDYQHFRYALFGTRTGNPNGVDVYLGKDLEHWEGPFPAFRPEEDSRADSDCRAAEAHYWRSNWYMFATCGFGKTRGIKVLKSEGSVGGPYKPIADLPVTPGEWECLDGTFFVDSMANPWTVFCRRLDGAFCAIPLSDDLSKATGEPVKMFSASESGWAKKSDGYAGGPFMFRNRRGDLFTLWSGVADDGCAIAQSRSLTGELKGPWKHYPPIYTADGGHAMIFPALDGRLMMVCSPARASDKPVFLELIEKDGVLALK